MARSLKYFISLAAVAMAIGCSPSKDQLKDTIEKNPEILFNAIEKNPEKFMEVVNAAVQKAQMRQREDASKAEETAREDELKNPKVAVIDPDRAMMGKADAPITIVEYSDFQCPYCSRGYQTMKQVQKKYGDKVRLVFKHLPLDFHPLAMPAAEYFEAIALQSAEKAYKFHDEIFENQEKLGTEKEAFLKKAAQKVGADMKKLAVDMKSEKVKTRISADMEEAKKFGISGTPGFLINGVSLKGAYPAPEFEKIIDKILADKKG